MATDVNLSELKVYSIGIVAEDKKLGSRVVEVTPIEDLTMLDGDINSNKKDSTVKSQDAQGGQYEVKTKTANSVPATWLPLGSSNRFTAPDVRRGERVVLYKFSDEEKYFWATLFDDIQLRKLETVIFAFSGTQEEDVEVNAENYYFLEVSTHKGLVHFHTSKKNGELCSYDIQINPKIGFIKVQDDMGNFFLFNTKEKQIALKNADDCSLEINKKNMTLTVPETYTLKAKKVIEEIGDTIDTKAGGAITEKSVSYNQEASGTVSMKSGGVFTINGNGVKISKKVALT